MLAALRYRSYKQAVLKRLDGSEPDAELPAGGQMERLISDALFVAMGQLAKLDGRVTRTEIEFANQLMQKLGLHNGARAHAIASFDLGKQQGSDAIQMLAQLVNSVGPRSALACQCLRILCRFAQLRGVIQLQGKILLRDIAEVLGYDKAELLEICAPQQASPTAKPAYVSSILRDAYSTLELDASAENLEVRKAYLRLMSRYHPDKIRRANLTPESLRFAQEQSMLVRTAYETVCGQRKIRA